MQQGRRQLILSVSNTCYFLMKRYFNNMTVIVFNEQTLTRRKRHADGFGPGSRRLGAGAAPGRSRRRV